jgi:uncharacterized protein with NRDE domain
MPAHEIGDVVKKRAENPTTGCYGTGKQIVILVDKDGKLVYVERTLFDSHAKPVPKDKRDLKFEFEVEGW